MSPCHRLLGGLRLEFHQGLQQRLHVTHRDGAEMTGLIQLLSELRGWCADELKPHPAIEQSACAAAEQGALDVWYDGDEPLVGVLLRPWDELPGWWFVMMNDEVMQWPENQLELV